MTLGKLQQKNNHYITIEDEEQKKEFTCSRTAFTFIIGDIIDDEFKLGRLEELLWQVLDAKNPRGQTEKEIEHFLEQQILTEKGYNYEL